MIRVAGQLTSRDNYNEHILTCFVFVYIHFIIMIFIISFLEVINLILSYLILSYLIIYMCVDEELSNLTIFRQRTLLLYHQ